MRIRFIFVLMKIPDTYICSNCEYRETAMLSRIMIPVFSVSLGEEPWNQSNHHRQVTLIEQSVFVSLPQKALDRLLLHGSPRVVLEGNVLWGIQWGFFWGGWSIGLLQGFTLIDIKFNLLPGWWWRNVGKYLLSEFTGRWLNLYNISVAYNAKVQWESNLNVTGWVLPTWASTSARLKMRLEVMKEASHFQV